MEKKWIHIYRLVIFIAFLMMARFLGGYVFQYIEQQQTFFADAGFLSSLSSRFAGIAALLADFIVQFFRSPWLSAAIVAGLLLLVAILSSKVFTRISGTDNFLLGLVPSMACFFQLLDANFRFFGIVAFILMLCGLYGYILIKNRGYRLLFAYLSIPALYLVAGPVALLYSLSLILIEASDSFKKALPLFAGPAIVFLLGELFLEKGIVGSFRHAFLPDAYYALYLKVYLFAWFIWLCWIVALVFSVLKKSFKKKNVTSLRIFLSFLDSVLVTFSIVIGTQLFYSRQNFFFTEMTQLARARDWDGIIEKCEKEEKYNVLVHNYINLALAEKGLQASRLFDFPLSGPRSLFVETNNEPYVTCLLSDVYFSMGEIGMSQRFAFEANEAWGGYSPYCLQRLIVTNILYEQYAVARKYIAVLKKSLFYRKWAEGCESACLDSKKACLGTVNALSGLHIDEDLKNIIRVNPTYHQAVQYLASLYLLNCDLESFMSMLEEFYGTPALPEVLPSIYQQAVITYADGDLNLCRRYKVNPEMIERYSRFRANPSVARNSFWFYFFRNI